MSERERLEMVRAEAQRFIARLDAVLEAEWSYSFIPPPKPSGAAKRASMDLTRALADYRAGRPIGDAVLRRAGGE